MSGLGLEGGPGFESVVLKGEIGGFSSAGTQEGSAGVWVSGLLA